MLMPIRGCLPQSLDARDLEILRIIQANGRISRTKLAAEVGLSLSPCVVRLARLERDGFIRGYRGLVDARRLGRFITVYVVVTLGRHKASDFTLFEKTIREIPEVLECDAVGGGIDYMLKLVTRDVEHYQQIIEDLLAREVGISNHHTYIVTKRVKESVGIPLDALIQRQ